MLQHVSGAWGWGRYVVVHPVGNSSVADGCARYCELLVDSSTFFTMTLEELLDASALPPKTTAVLRRRYIPGSIGCAAIRRQTEEVVLGRRVGDGSTRTA
jgi:hypothetical protein